MDMSYLEVILSSLLPKFRCFMKSPMVFWMAQTRCVQADSIAVLNSGCHLAAIELLSLQLASLGILGGCEQKESGQ